MAWTDVPDFTVGQVLTSSRMNQMRNNDNIGHRVCTSATRPASPDAGTMIYETDTQKILIYSGSVWQPPWNTAWGILGIAQQPGVVTNATTSQVDITGSSITATVAANRRIRMTASIEPYYASTAWANFYPWQDSTQLNQMTYPRSDAYISTVGIRITLTNTITTSAAATSVFKWRFSSPTSVSCSVFSSAGEYSQYTVEDVGPA